MRSHFSIFQISNRILIRYNINKNIWSRCNNLNLNKINVLTKIYIEAIKKFNKFI